MNLHIIRDINRSNDIGIFLTEIFILVNRILIILLHIISIIFLFDVIVFYLKIFSIFAAHGHIEYVFHV